MLVYRSLFTKATQLGSFLDNLEAGGTAPFTPSIPQTLVNAILKAGVDAQQMTITLGATTRSDQDIMFDVPPVTAIIEWGSGKYQESVEIDFFRGTQLSVVGSFVRVNARNDVNQVPSLLQNRARVGAFIGLDPVARTSQLTKTALVDENGVPLSSGPAIPAGGIVTIRPPRFARGLFVARGREPPASGAGSMRIIFNPPITAYYTFPVDFFDLRYIPLPIHLASVAIENTDADAQRFSPIWQIGL